MEQEAFDFKRFFGLFKRLAYVGDRDELRKVLVSRYTNGRTDELRYIRESEYEALCASLERELGIFDEVSLKHRLRRKRSACLHLMQKLGRQHCGLVKGERPVPRPEDMRQGLLSSDRGGA